MKLATQLVQFDAAPGDPNHPSSTPIYQTATFEQECATEFGPYDYSRSGNPTRDVVQKQIARIEGAEAAFVHSSGMASIAAIASLVKPGQEVVLGSDIYGGTYRYFTKVLAGLGTAVRHVDTCDLGRVGAALNPSVRLLLVESPTNPSLHINDLGALSRLCRSTGTLLVVDNTLMSPVLCKPLQVGADIVVHSATKALAGHGDLSAGAVAVAAPEIAERIAFFTNAAGSGLGPFESWLLLRGMKTLSLRVERQARTADRLAASLVKRPGLLRVLHPSLADHPGRDLHFQQARAGGSVLCFETGSVDRSASIVERCRLFRTTVSFGSVTSSISMPNFMSHASIPNGERALAPDLVRVSVGIEDFEDLWEDLKGALDSSISSGCGRAAINAQSGEAERGFKVGHARSSVKGCLAQTEPVVPSNDLNPRRSCAKRCP